MKNSSVKNYLVLILLLTVSLWLFFVEYRSSLVFEFALKVNRFIEQNLSKNLEIKKHAFDIIQQTLKCSPNHEYIEYGQPDNVFRVSSDNFSPINLNSVVGNLIKVNDTQQLFQAFKNAEAGDVILLSHGIYKLSGKSFKVANAGKKNKPITLTTNTFGNVTLKLDSLEGLLLDKPYWTISNLIFKGNCELHSQCEHAIHLTGDADFVQISRNRFINFNAHIKSNGINGRFPDNVIVEKNDFYNKSPRHTKSPVTPIDVVGGNNWVIKNNFIADFAVNNPQKFAVAYGAFLKGGGKQGKIVNNFVNCAWKIPHQSFLDIRIGLSLGGGGTGARFCQNSICEPEHENGFIENNTVYNCQNDVSIYLNKAKSTTIKNNILVNSLGIDVRFPSSSATLINNQFHGRISVRDGAKVTTQNNQSVSHNKRKPLANQPN